MARGQRSVGGVSARAAGPLAVLGAVLGALALLAGCTVAAPVRSPVGNPVQNSGASARSERPAAAARPTTPPRRSARPISQPTGAGAVNGSGPLIASARWVTREGERALVVVPTARLREHGGDEATPAWGEVLRRQPDAATPGMRDQFVCHTVFATGKKAWFLEPARANVGYLQTVREQCNPGHVRDFG